ncbi:hypothetical protein L226DRAFT_560859 [Lentinus tigrinus ALCF2SS1-7]|uniref:uncharacterized protein n=1 Tax=Lentinus tigrinus ALCF2SS1-7 TaxID=1328758 RepID=UPI001165E185|nr:hypothetical protein L226DRAFT_560859 [Lentinus tigrinus ALCF2SS1-7]
MAMKNMKQTTLSFTSAQRKVDAPSKPTCTQDATPRPTASSSKTAKSQKGKKTSSGPVRHTKMDVYVEIPPAARGPRATPSARASSVRSASTRMSAYGLPRKPSTKRKLSPEPEVDRWKEGIPRITVDPASSQPMPSSDDQGNPPKKPRLFSSSPLSALTPLPPSDAPSSVHGADMDDVEFVPTSQSDELELALPIIEEKDPSDVQEVVDRWRKETLPEPPSRADSPCASDRFGFPLSDIPMDVDYNMFCPPLTIPDTPVAESRGSGSGIPYPHTPLSAHGDVLEVPSNTTMATSDAAWATPMSRIETPSQRDVERKAPAPDVSPSDAFRSLTPPPSSSDIEEEAMQQDVPIVEALDVQSKTEQLIADIKARALAAARSSPELPRKELGDLSDSDLESDSDDDDDLPGLVAQLIRDTKGKAKVANTTRQAGPSKSSPTATPRYNLRRASPKAKAATPATQVRKRRKADPVGALLREKQRDERNGTGMVLLRGAEVTLAESKAGLRDEMEDEEDGSSSDSDAELVRRGAKGKGKSSPPPAGPSRTQKAKRKDDDGSDDDEYIVGLDCEAILGKEGGEAVGKILANDIKEKMARALAKLKEVPLGVPFWARANEHEAHDDDMDAETPLPPFTAEDGGSAIRQTLKAIVHRNDVSQLCSLLSLGFVSLLNTEQYAVVVPWLFTVAFSDVNPSLSTLTYAQLLRLAPLVGSQPSGLRLSHVLVALTRLGASASVLERHEWIEHVDGASPSTRATDEEWRGEMAYRLMSLLAAFAQSFARDKLIDILLALVLVGMDPTTSDELQTTIRKTCDIVVGAMTPSQEFAACTKIVPFGKTLTPSNQVLLISFIPSISPATVRMARCIARALLLDNMPTALEYEDGLPDLTPIVDLLAPAAGSGGPFDIPGNSEQEGFYDDLTCRVALLARVLSDIDEYTLRAMEESRRKAEARKNGHPEDDDEPDNHDGKEAKLTVLEQIKRNLDLLHGKIVDTRAAHLDRSRAKAALQRLSFRVHYQRVATTKSGHGKARPRTIAGYFSNHSN